LPIISGSASGKAPASRSHRPAPQVEAGVAVRRNGEHRHALARLHRRRVEQKFPIERELAGGLDGN
jgi:hypothetical protein